MAFCRRNQPGSLCCGFQCFLAPKNMARMKTAVSTAFYCLRFYELFSTLIGYFLLRQYDACVHTPKIFCRRTVIFKDLRVWYYILLLYNVCTGIFTALGDSKTPLYFLIVPLWEISYWIIIFCSLSGPGSSEQALPGLPLLLRDFRHFGSLRF